MRKLVSVLCLLVWICSGIVAQSHLVASGGNVTGSTGSVSYTAGQIDFITQIAPNAILTEGVQQPFVITVVSGIKEAVIQLEAVVFPNPATDYVELKVLQHFDATLNYQLIDLQGRVLAKDRIHGETTKIEMANLSNGIYYLKVGHDHDLAKTFQILINQ